MDRWPGSAMGIKRELLLVWGKERAEQTCIMEQSSLTFYDWHLTTLFMLNKVLYKGTTYKTVKYITFGLSKYI